MASDNSISKKTRLFISLILAGVLSLINVDVKVFGQKIDSLFTSDELIYLELRADFNSIQEDRWKEDEEKGGEPVYHEAILRYGSEENPVEVPVRVKARGNFRRNPKYCSFPPLLFNFKKEDTKNTIFEGQDKPKLVAPCQNEPEVIKEYIVYKMYNLLTDWSFKVRLAKILYYNTAKDKKLMERYSFFIEEDDKVAKRNDAKVVRKHHYPFDLNPDYEAMVSMFQFMIGNPDWYYTTGQNMDAMYPKDTTLLPIPVGYDFDYSEFVNADYTKPAGVPDEYLAEKRIFKGMCLTDEKLEEVIDLYNSMRPKFEDLIDGNEYLPKYGKKECRNYLEEFYDIINTEELLNSQVLDTCYTRKDYLPFE